MPFLAVPVATTPMVTARAAKAPWNRVPRRLQLSAFRGLLAASLTVATLEDVPYPGGFDVVVIGLVPV